MTLRAGDAAVPEKAPCPLTAYQLAVLKWASLGKRDAEIAELMGNTTEGAIQQHMFKVFDRLGATSRAGAVGIALRKGWIE